MTTDDRGSTAQSTCAALTIQQASTLLTVPVSTLRSWEPPRCWPHPTVAPATRLLSPLLAVAELTGVPDAYDLTTPLIVPSALRPPDTICARSRPSLGPCPTRPMMSTVKAMASKRLVPITLRR